MRKVEITSFNANWAQMFKEEAKQFQDIFGSDMLAIHHIGSTSVPGLKAKPIIDIMPVVNDIDAVDHFNKEMEKIGYEPKGEFGIAGRRYFRKGEVERTHHVHFFQAGHSDIKRHLAFRDYLRAHHDVADMYGELKESLAKRFLDNMDAYIEGKEPFVLEWEKKALIWYDAK